MTLHKRLEDHRASGSSELTSSTSVLKLILEMNEASTIIDSEPKLTCCMYRGESWGLSLLKIHMRQDFGVFCNSCVVWVLSLIFL